MTIYFASPVDDPTLIKIGFSDNIAKRLKHLAGSFEKGIKLLATCEGGRDTELVLHNLFKDFRTEGEWFRSNSGLQALIDLRSQVNGEPVEPLIFNRRPDGSSSNAQSDCELAHGLLGVLLKASDELSIARSLEEVFKSLHEANPVWTRRRVRSIWNKEALRIDHYEICDLRALAEWIAPEIRGVK